MYHINDWNTGETVATFRLDPYRFDMKKPDKDGVRQMLKSAESLRQMNRTAGGETDADGGTSLEGYQDPSDDFRLTEVTAALTPGYAVVKADGE